MTVLPTSLVQRLTHWLRPPAPAQLYYVSDKSQWSFYWDAHYITRHLATDAGCPARVTCNPWKLRRQIIHFGDRYQLLDGPAEKLAASNHLFVTWFHGRQGDPAMRPYFARLRDIQPHLRGIVTTCQASVDELIRDGVDARLLHLIPLGVDLQRFTFATAEQRQRVRRALDLPHDALLVGSFQKDGAGWGDGMEPKHVKGPDLFLEVIARLRRQVPRLAVVLTGPARGFVKAGLQKLRVPFVHRFVADYWELVPYYQALDLYIIASRCEGGPKSLVECWATGVPVVSTRMGMPADWIRQGQNGFLADVEDIQGLAEAAARLAHDAALRETVARQAQLDVLELDWRTVARQYYERLYQPIYHKLAA